MIRRLSTLIFSLIICSALNAQISNTMYFMDRVPEVSQLNPAVQPKCNVFIGTFFSGFQLNFGNNSLSLNDIIFSKKITVNNRQRDSMVTFLYDSATQSNFLKTLKGQNSLFFNVQYDILNLGFRVQDMYFTFGITARSYFSISYPHDIVKLFLTGIDVDTSGNTTKVYDFKNFGVNSTAFGEFSFGFSKKINEELTFGIRGKLLRGTSIFSTSNKKLQLQSSAPKDSLFKLVISSDATINISQPLYDITLDSTNKPKFTQRKKISIKPFANMGLGIDLGATYSGIDQFIFSASLIDFGFIRWNDNVTNLKLNGNFTYPPKDDTINFLSNKSPDIFKKITDSLQNIFKFTQQNTAFTTWLPTKIYIGAEYFPETYFSLGLLSATQYYQSKLDEQIMVSANFRPLKMLMFSGSYSIIGNGFTNVGFGMSLRFSALNFYIISDNLPIQFAKYNSIPIPYKAQNFNLRMGFNLVFGCNNGQKKKLKDKPLIWE